MYERTSRPGTPPVGPPPGDILDRLVRLCTEAGVRSAQPSGWGRLEVVRARIDQGS